METLHPQSPEQLAGALRQFAGAGKSISLGGASTKDRMGGPSLSADVRISTSELQRVIQYEPQDLTVSVEAGMKWAEFQRLLAANHQTVPLDPPLYESATVGGVVASNSSGPRRRWYGTARDVVIGMKFATLDGKLAQTGGMVVKNVAGLDMGKLLIGSFGTLAAVAVVNFKVSPSPQHTRTFIVESETVEQAIAARDRLLRGVLQPSAIDLLNPHAAARLGFDNYALLAQAAGNEKVIERWQREMQGAAALEGAEERALWDKIREFSPAFVADNHQGSVARVSVTLEEVGALVGSTPVPVLARAGSGVCYAHFADSESGARWLHTAVDRGWDGVLEWVPGRECAATEQWPRPGDDFATMKRIKLMFDPQTLLNRGRLYGRI